MSEIPESFEQRFDAFMAEYEALREKYQVDIIPQPMPVPIGNGVWGLTMQPQAVNLKEQEGAVKSPFITQE